MQNSKSSDLTRGSLRLLAEYFPKDSFFTSSLLMFIGLNLANFGQLIYHFWAVRFLGPVYYGDLAAIVAVLGLFAIVQMAFGLTIVKYISSERDKRLLLNLTRFIYHWSFWISVSFFVVILILSVPILRFLNIQDFNAVYILAPAIFLFVLINALRSILQGLLKFGLYTLSLAVEVFVKLPLLVVLLFWGVGVFGALFAWSFGVLVSIVFVRVAIANFLKGRYGGINVLGDMLRFSVPVLIQALALTSMYSVDVILVKHFFAPAEAGVYAGLAKLGTVAFFGASPIANVMFPMISRRHSHGEPYHRLFFASLALVLLISIFVILIYRFFGSFVVGLLYGAEFMHASGYLWLFGVFMSLVGIAALITQFYLSIGKVWIVSLFAIAALLQALLIWFVHGNILEVVAVSIFSVSLLVLALLVYFPYHHR